MRCGICWKARTGGFSSKLTEQQQDARTYVVPQPAMHTIVDDLPRHPTLRYERRHAGTDHAPGRTPYGDAACHGTAQNRRATRCTGCNTGQGRVAGNRLPLLHTSRWHHRPNELCWKRPAITYIRHNEYSVGIVFAGSFMNGRIPSSAQLRSGAHLIAWLMQELNITLARVWGHREFPTTPPCVQAASGRAATAGAICYLNAWSRYRPAWASRVFATTCFSGSERILVRWRARTC